MKSKFPQTTCRFATGFVCTVLALINIGIAGAQEPKSTGQRPATAGQVQRPAVPMVIVGSRVISVQDYVTYLQRHPELLPTSLTPAGKLGIVRDMLKEHLLEYYLLKEGLIDAPLNEKPLSSTATGVAFNRLRAKYFPAPPPPTEQQAKRFYDENRELFAIPASIRVSQIQIRVPAGADATVRGKARARALEALHKIRSGQSFESIAAEYTDHAHGKYTNGDLGFVPARTGDAFFDTHVASLKPGETSGVLESPVGYEIYRVTEHGEAIYTPYEDSRTVSAQYMKHANEQARNAFFRLAAKEAGIKVMMPELAAAGNF